MISSSFQRYGIYVFLTSLSCLYYLANATVLLGHYDLGWHLAAGDLIRESRSIPFKDPWSFTAGDTQWFNVSWLWDAIASAIYQYTGFGGLVVLVIACGAALTGYLTFVCIGSGASTISVCISVLIACLLYPGFVSYPNIYLSASPNMATMLFSVIFYGVCLKRTRWFVLPPVMLLWANLHGGFVLGLFIIGVFGAVALLRRDWANVRIYAAAGIGCFIATFVNPLGWRLYEGLTTVLGHFSQAYITEWWSYYENITMPGSIPGILYILIFALFELTRRTPCPLEARVLSWFFLCLGFYQYRYMSFFFLFSAMPFALHLDQVLTVKSDDARMKTPLLAAGLIALCALPVVFMKMQPTFALPAMLAEQDTSYLQTHFARARLLNHWNFGGILIFRDRGKIPVFVDGRAATAYSDGLLRDYFKLGQTDVNEDDWNLVLDKYKIDTVLWVKAHEPLRQLLVGKKGWKEVYTGEYASIYVKP